MKIWRKLISVVASSALLFNSFIAPLSILAQETPNPEYTQIQSPYPDQNPDTEEFTEEENSPNPTPGVVTNSPTPTPETSVVINPSPSQTPTDQPLQTQAPESNPTTTSPPDKTATPTPSPTTFTDTFADENTGIVSVKVATTNIFPDTIQQSNIVKLITDKLDYSPTEVAVITGLGFTPNKIYTLIVSSNDEPSTSTNVQITVDSKGDFTYNYQLDGKYRPNYLVEVKDGEEVIAVTTFTDAILAEISESSFSIVVLPDTQFYSESYPSTFTAQTQFIVDNKDTLNVAYVPHLGDVVNSPNSTQYDRAKTSMDILKNSTIPFGILRGNHDSNSSMFNNYFGTSYFSGKDFYGGHYGSNNDNNYSLFSAGGNDYIVINLSYAPSSDVLDWANNLLATNINRRGIIASHSILNTNGSFTTEGNSIFNKVKSNSNLFLMLCGHMHGEARRTETGTSGNKIEILLSDYQSYSNGGDGYLRLMEFTAENKINVKTYSVTKNEYETDSNSQFTIELDSPVTPLTNWTAYNDLVWASSQINTNITTYSHTGSTGGLLKDYATGNNIGVSATITKNGNITNYSSNGSGTASGTDAYNTFHGKVDMTGVVNYSSSAGWWVEVTFTGLDSSKTYTFATSANRNNDSYTGRVSKFTISDIDSASNKSTTGTTVISNESVSFSTGNNYSNGYVARWENINPGTDGDFTIRVEAGSSVNEAYGPSVFMLTEESSGSVTPPPIPSPNCPVVSLTASADTTMRSGNTRGSYNYGGSPTIRLNPYYEQGSNDGQLTGILIKWNIDGATIPPEATIAGANISFNVTDGSNSAYGLYNMRRGWTEGTNNGASGSGASWNYYGAGTGSWGTAGAENTSSDRYNSNLWSATAGTFNTTGKVNIPLNNDGVSVIQGWREGSNNHGLTIQNYSGSATDIWVADSRESSVEANRPKLNITYCMPDAQNSAPVALDDNVLTNEDVSVDIDVLANDSDADGDPLTVTITNNPSNGLATVLVDNKVRYTPNPDFNGVDSFAYQVSDGENVDTAIVYITIAAVNDKPVANPMSFSINEDNSKVFTLTGSDVDADSLVFQVVTNPSKGSLSGTAPNLVYTPNTDVYGNDSFTFRVNDGLLDSDIATVSITINPVNDAPVATNDSYSISEGGFLDILPPGVLGNDFDIDSISLTTSLIDGAVNGQLSLNANGGFSYTPNAGFSGSDQFTYKTYDGELYSDIATVTIYVVSVPAPIISSESVSDVTSSSVTINWTTDHPATSRVVYDTISHETLGSAPNYGYTNSTTENSTKITNHSVTVTGLSPNTTYYFRSVSHGSPESIGNEVFAITTNIPAKADLVVAKINNVQGLATINQPFNWNLTVTNNGGSSAVFNNQIILRDDLPGNADYSISSVTKSGGTTGTITCNINSDLWTGNKTLSCGDSSWWWDNVTIPTGGSFTVILNVTSTQTGVLNNPRMSSGWWWDNPTCKVDPDNVINESNKSNNNCSDSVTVRQQTGSITVCKVIINPQGNITDWSGLPSATFRIDWTGGGGLSPTVINTTDLPNTKIFAGSVENDAYCTTYSGLPLANYGYSQEQITGTGWETPKYNDQFNSTVLSLNDFYDYLAPGNENSNGYIDLTNQAGPDRTLVVLNQYQITELPNLSIMKSNDISESVGSNSVINYHITVTNTGNVNALDAKVVDVLPGGFSYVTGSTTGDATESDLSVSGTVLTWNIGSLIPGESKTVNFKILATSNAADGTYTNFAFCSAASGTGERIDCTNFAESDVIIRDSISYSGNLGGQVLGISTDILPATGSSTFIFATALSFLGGGLYLLRYANRKLYNTGKKNKKHAKN